MSSLTQCYHLDANAHTHANVDARVNGPLEWFLTHDPLLTGNLISARLYSLPRLCRDPYFS